MMNVTALHHNHRVKINNYTQLSDYSISVPHLTSAYLSSAAAGPGLVGAGGRDQ